MEKTQKTMTSFFSVKNGTGDAPPSASKAPTEPGKATTKSGSPQASLSSSAAESKPEAAPFNGTLPRYIKKILNISESVEFEKIDMGADDTCCAALVAMGALYGCELAQKTRQKGAQYLKLIALFQVLSPVMHPSWYATPVNEMNLNTFPDGDPQLRAKLLKDITGRGGDNKTTANYLDSPFLAVLGQVFGFGVVIKGIRSLLYQPVRALAFRPVDQQDCSTLKNTDPVPVWIAACFKKSHFCLLRPTIASSGGCRIACGPLFPGVPNPIAHLRGVLADVVGAYEAYTANNPEGHVRVVFPDPIASLPKAKGRLPLSLSAAMSKVKATKFDITSLPPSMEGVAFEQRTSHFITWDTQYADPEMRGLRDSKSVTAEDDHDASPGDDDSDDKEEDDTDTDEDESDGKDDQDDDVRVVAQTPCSAKQASRGAGQASKSVDDKDKKTRGGDRVPRITEAGYVTSPGILANYPITGWIHDNVDDIQYMQGFHKCDEAEAKMRFRGLHPDSKMPHVYCLACPKRVLARDVSNWTSHIGGKKHKRKKATYQSQPREAWAQYSASPKLAAAPVGAVPDDDNVTRDDILYALGRGVGMNPHMYEQLMKKAGNAFFGFKVPARSNDVKVLQRVMRRVDAKYAHRASRQPVFAAVDGGSDKKRKVCLIALHSRCGTFLCEPVTSDASLDAATYAEKVVEATKKLQVSKQQLIAVVTDNWSGNAKVARELEVPRIVCLAHLVNLACKDLHKELNMEDIPLVLNVLTNIESISSELDAAGVPVKKLRNVDHRFAYLLEPLTTLAAHRHTIRRVLTPHLVKIDSAQGSSKSLDKHEGGAGSKRRASSNAVNAKPAKRPRTDASADVEPLLHFPHKDPNKAEYPLLNFLYDFLRSDLEFTRLHAYLDLLRPLAEIIKDSENDGATVPFNLLDKINAVTNAAVSMVTTDKTKSRLNDRIATLVRTAKTELSEEQVRVDNGLWNGKKFVSANLTERERLANDLIRANLRVLARLPNVPSSFCSPLAKPLAKSRGASVCGFHDPGFMSNWTQDPDNDEDDTYEYKESMLKLRSATRLSYKYYFARSMCDPRNPRRPDLELFLEIAKLARFHERAEQGASGSDLFEEYGRFMEAHNELHRSPSALAAIADDPEKWFTEKGAAFPNVAIVMQTMLAMPVSVASVERGFSIVHHISADARRSCRKDEVTKLEIRLRYSLPELARLEGQEPEDPFMNTAWVIRAPASSGVAAARDDDESDSEEDSSSDDSSESDSG